MKIINDLGMPEHAFKAICLRQGRLEPPKLDYIGVTTLMGPPLPRYLNARYWHQLEVKASETMNALQGQMGHLLFDKVESDTQTELHLKMDIDGQTIYGVADYYDPNLKVLGDAKFKQVNSVTATNIRGNKDLETQLNIYCFMARKMGLDVQSLQGDIYINGWTVYRSYGDSAYPKAPYLKVPIPIWEAPFTENYIKERVKIHNTEAIRLLKSAGTANTLAIDKSVDDQLYTAEMLIPVCTDEERFMQPTKYAVMRDGQKKAVKLFANFNDAHAFVQTQPNPFKLSVTERKGGYMRCQFYCNVRKFCPYVKSSLRDEEKGI